MWDFRPTKTPNTRTETQIFLSVYMESYSLPGPSKYGVLVSLKTTAIELRLHIVFY